LAIAGCKTDGEKEVAGCEVRAVALAGPEVYVDSNKASQFMVACMGEKGYEYQTEHPLCTDGTGFWGSYTDAYCYRPAKWPEGMMFDFDALYLSRP
jgi:hypothetical protein